MKMRSSLLYLIPLLCTAVVGSSPNLDVIRSYTDLSQLAQAIEDTGFDSIYMFAPNPQVFMAPGNSAFDAFVSDWRNKGLNIAQFSDLPKELQRQILEYHFTYDDWSPYHICKYTKTATGNSDTSSRDGYKIGPTYRPVGPGQVIGSIYASIEEGNPVIAGHCHPDRKLHVCFQLSHLCKFVYTESMTVTVVDEYTESRASFGLVHSKYHGNFLIHFLDKVLIPGSAMNTLEQMASDAQLEGLGPQHK